MMLVKETRLLTPLSTGESSKDQIMTFFVWLDEMRAVFVLRLIDRLAGDEPAETQTAGRGVFHCVLTMNRTLDKDSPGANALRLSIEMPLW
jgi:hypothetical protein